MRNWGKIEVFHLLIVTYVLNYYILLDFFWCPQLLKTDILLNKQYNLKLSYLLLKIILCLKTLVPKEVAQHVGKAMLCPCNTELLQLYAFVPQHAYSKTGGRDWGTRWRFPSQLARSL